jgi:hypothetical protein
MNFPHTCFLTLKSGSEMTQAHPSFSSNKFTTHCVLGGCITVISFVEWF